MNELLYTNCSWCLRSMDGIEASNAFALAKPFSDQLKAGSRGSLTNCSVPLAGKEIPTLILGSEDAATARWVLCRQECSDALAQALEAEFNPNSTNHSVDQLAI